MALSAAQQQQFDTMILELQDATRLLQEARAFHQTKGTGFDEGLLSLESKKTALQEQVNVWIADARRESTIFRLTKNQPLANGGGLPEGWSAHPSCTFEQVCSIGHSPNPADRHIEAQELFASMGINPVSLGRAFSIMRLSWPAGTPYLMYQSSIQSVYQTVAAWTKLESGGLNSGMWASGATSSWKLTGTNIPGSTADRYLICHPIPNGQAGSILVALPAMVAGYVDLTKNLWGVFPYIGDDKNE